MLCSVINQVVECYPEIISKIKSNMHAAVRICHGFPGTS